LKSIYSPVVVSGRPNASPGVDRGKAVVCNCNFLFLETAMTLRRSGGEHSATINCRGMGGSRTLHNVSQCRDSEVRISACRWFRHADF
jgi:hypothetical protein